MNRKTVCFTSGTVVCKLDSTEKYAAIHELIEKAPVFRNLSNQRSFEKAVVEREKSQSTGYGKGVAFAHGRAAEVEHLFIALGISRQGISWDAVDGRPVHLLFIIANNPHRQLEYLCALSSLAEMMRDDVLRTRLINGGSTEQLEKLLCHAFTDSWAMKTA